MKFLSHAAALSVLGLSAQSTAALPRPPLDQLAPIPLIENVASWRYHNNCGWQGGRWVVDLGAGKFVVCRPNRPSRDYNWRREGNREGWYDRRSKGWHFDKW
jgi:hypothetical protein